MRKYAIGAMLLDRHDPSKVLGRTPNPLLSAADEDREGYVPNVVYTCGAIRVGEDLFLPYGVADSSVCFAFMPIADILAAMEMQAATPGATREGLSPAERRSTRLNSSH